MTKEEALKILKYNSKVIHRTTNGRTDSKEVEALDTAIKALDRESNTWSLEDAREDFMHDVYNTLDFLPTNYEANRIIDSFDRVTSDITQQPCEDCISRQTAIRWVKRECNPYGKPTLDFESGKRVLKYLEQMPPVTPKYTDEEIDRAQAVEQAYIDKMVELAVEELKRPKGEWISKPLVYGVTYCSECNFELKINNTNYCPNCGARMIESEE